MQLELRGVAGNDILTPKCRLRRSTRYATGPLPFAVTLGLSRRDDVGICEVVGQSFELVHAFTRSGRLAVPVPALRLLPLLLTG